MPASRSHVIRPFIALAMVTASTLYALAQQPPTPTRVRGTVEGVDGDTLAVKSRSGEEVKLHMAGNMVVLGLTKIALSDIKVGSFIGTTTVPGPDGMPKAVEVHVFPENMRGTGEGSRPYDLKPNSSMTNATVSQSVVSNDGQTLLVKYKDGEKKVQGRARYAGRDLCSRRQGGPEGRCQGHRLHEEAAGRLVRDRSRQCRSRQA